MNDALYEQLVVRKPKAYDLPLKILLILVIISIAILGMPFIGLLAALLASLVGMLAYYFIFPKFNVEYEYAILNHDFQIDAIYNKAKRKSIKNFDLQSAEIIAPKDSSRLRSYHPDKVFDFSSGNSNAKAFAIMLPLDQKNACVYIEPDDKMIDHMKQWMGSKMYLD